MGSLIFFGRKLEHATKLIPLSKLGLDSLPLRGFSLSRPVNFFWIHLLYFVFISILGHLSIMALGFNTHNNKPKDLDVFFTSVSAVTLSSMTTVEMEVFSHSQNVIFTLIMFLGGEVFTSWLEFQLLLQGSNIKSTCCLSSSSEVVPYESSSSSSDFSNQMELGCSSPKTNLANFNIIDAAKLSMRRREIELKQSSIKSLGSIVLTYLVVVQLVGSFFIYLYFTIISGAREILKNKGINPVIFSVFLSVSTFVNCGFVPTNENMMVFISNSGLLWMLIPLILMGNTLYSVFLRLIIWVLDKLFSNKREEFGYMLRNGREIGYSHLISSMQSWHLSGTVGVFILVQLVMLCVMEWESRAWEGLNWYQKLVASLFQVSNTRHSGESVIDFPIISPAILVLFVAMMYLPPYTSFMPNKNEEEKTAVPQSPGKEANSNNNRKKKLMEHLMFSQLSYLVIFVILICITERKSLKEDPINFSIFNIVFEVISAYGNVGFTTAYSCKRRINGGGGGGNFCEDKWIGFVGHWSTEGKLILIVVMLFGRLKKFSRRGGAAWELA